MPAKIDVKYQKTFSTTKSLDNTFQLLSDLERTIPKDFPGLESFEKLAPNTYRWSFETVKYASYEFQVKVVTQFSFVGTSTIQMVSVPQPGHSDLQGSWKLQANGAGTSVIFDVNLSAELPIPSFLKAMAAPITQKELGKLFDRYISNVAKTLSA